MLSALYWLFIIGGIIYVVVMLIWFALMGVGGVLSAILSNRVTGIIFGLGMLALGGWLMYAGWIEEDIHWAWAAFVGMPVAELALLIIIPWKKMLLLVPLTLLAYGGWLVYAGWIEEDIHWAWSAFAGIPCLLCGLAALAGLLGDE